MPWWQRLIEPLDPLEAGDQRKARLLSALLLSLVVLGATSAVIQAASIPNFHSTLLAMGVALLVLALAYAGSRTRLYRISAALAAATPALACIATGIESPDDHVWYAFMLIAVVVTSLFFSLRTAALVAAALFTTLCLLPIWVLEFRAPARIVPLLALHGILSPLLLIGARHHAALERDHQAELRRRDALIAELKQREALTRSAAKYAHDINNLATIIDASVVHLDERYVLGRSEAVAEIRGAIERLTSLSRDVMSSGRAEPERTRTLDLDQLVSDMVPLLAQIAGPRVELKLGPSRSALKVTVDPLRVEQVLMNLVSNARDAMPDGGPIRIECGRVAPRNAGADGAGADGANGEYAAIDVIDGGIGMSAATLQHIFEPFFTTKPLGRGTGLGLAIVRDIVTECGGQVTVTSEPGRGSRFRTLWPLG